MRPVTRRDFIGGAAAVAAVASTKLSFGMPLGLAPGIQLYSVREQMAKDFERTFAVLKSLPVDYFLGAHGAYFDLETKYPKLKAGDTTVFIDPAGYKSYVADREQAFRSELAKQKSKN